MFRNSRSNGRNRSPLEIHAGGFGFDRLDFDRSNRIWLIGCRMSCAVPLFPLEPDWNSAEDLSKAFQDYFDSDRWAIFAWTVNHNKMHDDIDFER